MPHKTLAVGRVNRQFYPGVNTIVEKIALADVNTGITILDNSEGNYKLRVNDVRFVAREAAATGLTLLRLITSEGTPVVIATAAQAQLTEDAHLKLGVTGFTAGAGFGVDLAKGTSLVVDKTGSALAGSDFIEVEVTFQILDGVSPREAPIQAVI